MAFKRSAETAPSPPPDVLTARMVGIGLNFAAETEVDAEIESTLIFASRAGMLEDSLRTLAVLSTWMGVHHTHVNADRLIRLASEESEARVRAYWSAIASWLHKDRRFARLSSSYDGPPVELLATGTELQIQRHGEDPRRHAGYRNRVLMGPSFRADVWTVLEKSPESSVAEVARRAACSFATAWQAVQDFKLLRAADSRT